MRVLQHFLGGAGLGDSAVIQDDDSLRQQQCVQQVVGDQHGRMPHEHPIKHPAQQWRDRDVQGCHRLVEQQQPRLGRQRPGDCHPLGLSAGKLAGTSVGELGSVHLIEPVHGVLGGRGSGDTLDPWAEGHVVEHTEVRKQQCVLGQQRDASGMWLQPAVPAIVQIEQHGVVEGRLPTVGAQSAGQDAEQCRFARSVVPEHRHPLAGADVDLDVEVTLSQLRPQVQAHAIVLSEILAVTRVTRTAMTTNTNESAMAASWSLTDCR
ncbi:hypothetical protein SDC9_97600 [bioreactor metagenome]|uniref:Uncharacterized protein n=1 Tax=bioreactor metagenome TaxID=1076179 RepID=A0A645AMK3_9ZZZZ